MCFIIVDIAATCLTSTTSSIFSTLTPSSLILLNSRTISSPEFTVKPIDLAKSEEGSPNLRNILRSDVPAIDASIPASVRTPITAVVSSKSIPNSFATGETFVIDVWNFSRVRAELVNEAAITSATLAPSVASKPKPLTVEPITVAVLAKSSPVAVAANKAAS